jgi:SAM-dependent methyltransferase
LGTKILSVLDIPFFWNLSRHILNITTGLYWKRFRRLKQSGLFEDNPSILDIGCGVGWFANISSGNYFGIDTDTRMLGYAQKKYPNKAFEDVSLKELQKKANDFDITLAVDLLHHLNDSECVELLEDIRSLTNKYLIVYEPVLYDKMNFLEKWVIKNDKGKDHRNLDRHYELFKQCGYVVKEKERLQLGFLTPTLFILEIPR